MSNSLFNLKNDTIFVIAEAPGGVYNSTQLSAINTLAEEYSPFLKVTEDERLGFMIPAEKVNQVHHQLAATGLGLRHYRDANHGSPKACLGELCPNSKQDALGLCLELAPLLQEKLKKYNKTITVGINGCAQVCASSPTDQIYLIGEDEGYSLALGGIHRASNAKWAAPICHGLSAEKIKDAVLACVDVYLEQATEEEDFSQTFHRLGAEPFAQACMKEELSLPETIQEEPLDSLTEGDVMSGQELDENAATEGLDEKEPVLGQVEEEPVLGQVEESVTPQKAEEALEGTQGGEAEEEEEVIQEDEEPLQQGALETYDKIEEDSTNIFEDPDLPTDTIRHKKKISIRVVDGAVAVKLPNGLDFFLPHNSLIEGETIDMQIEKETFFLECLYGKLRIKYGSMDITIPMDKRAKEEEEES